MKADLRLVSADHSSSAPIDSRLARLLRALSSLASVTEVPDRLGRKSASSPSPPSSPGLVVEFDEAYTVFVDGLEELPSESQMIALQAVDTKLSAMVRAEDAALWTVQARIEDPCWIEVRVLVVDAMNAFSLRVDMADAPRANDVP